MPQIRSNVQRDLFAWLDLLKAFLDSGANAQVIRASRGLGMGFVDGDMQLLWLR